MTGPISGHARTRHPAQGVGSYPMILRRPLPDGRRSHVYFRSSKCDVVLQAAIRGGQDGKFKDAMRAAGTDKIKRRRKRCPLNPMPNSIMDLRPCRRRQRRQSRSARWLPRKQINGAPLPAPQSPAAAKAPTVKAAGRVAKPLKPAAARHPGSHGQPRQIANKDKARFCKPTHRQAGTERRSQGRNTDDPAKPGNQWDFRICAERCELAYQHHRQTI